MPQLINIFWFRRDLRLNDNCGLHAALTSGLPVLPIFIFDKNILNQLENKKDKRVEFIFDSLGKINQQLAEYGSSVHFYHGTPEEIFMGLIKVWNIQSVYYNEDYEPYARSRESAVFKLCNKNGINFSGHKDQVIFSKDEVLKDDRSPYTVFTPYSRKWKQNFQESKLPVFPSEKLVENFIGRKPSHQPTLESIGFRGTDAAFPELRLSKSGLNKYEKVRNFPAADATSHLGIHLRFGTLSIRKLVAHAIKFSPTFLNELIWREFYQMILWHFPKVGEGKSFKPAYDNIKWLNDEAQFERWCGGKTGFPIVDAGMRQLNETGFMHNRVRMITASFLCKHLLIDWRWGEAYFAEKLLDFDLAANNGGWQWCSSSGCDSAPYFRIFNPDLQTEKFDPHMEYIKRWVSEFGTTEYPAPMIEHAFARKRCLAAYQEALQEANK